MGYTVLIPARLASSRLPNKPLAEIAGVPMVVRVAQRVLSGVPASTRVVVAADHPSILQACKEHGIEAVLTREDHPSGSDRLAEACDLLGLTDDEIAALTKAPDTHDWRADDLALIAMADELAAGDCVSDATWAALAARWNDAELVELLIVAGFYRLVSGFLNSAGVQLDPGVPGFPTA